MRNCVVQNMHIVCLLFNFRAGSEGNLNCCDWLDRCQRKGARARSIFCFVLPLLLYFRPFLSFHPAASIVFCASFAWETVHHKHRYWLNLCYTDASRERFASCFVQKNLILLAASTTEVPARATVAGNRPGQAWNEETNSKTTQIETHPVSVCCCVPAAGRDRTCPAWCIGCNLI